MSDWVEARATPMLLPNWLLDKPEKDCKATVGGMSELLQRVSAIGEKSLARDAEDSKA